MIEISDDDFSRYVDDPTQIPSVEICAEILKDLNAQISSIQASLDEYDHRWAGIEPSPAAARWHHRALEAKSHRCREVNMVWRRSKELRGTKGPSREKSAPDKALRAAANVEKQARLRLEAQALADKRLAERIALQVQREEIALRERESRRAASSAVHFVTEARRILPPELFDAIMGEARATMNGA